MHKISQTARTVAEQKVPFPFPSFCVSLCPRLTFSASPFYSLSHTLSLTFTLTLTHTLTLTLTFTLTLTPTLTLTLTLTLTHAELGALLRRDPVTRHFQKDRKALERTAAPLLRGPATRQQPPPPEYFGRLFGGLLRLYSGIPSSVTFIKPRTPLRRTTAPLQRDSLIRHLHKTSEPSSAAYCDSTAGSPHLSPP